MSRKFRLFRLVSIVLLVLVFGSYFAFATFLFNPLEGSFKLDVSALVPRDVDFFFARSDLGGLFQRFPHLRDEERLARHEAWRTFRESPEFADFDAQYGILQSLSDLEADLAKVPGAIDVQEIFGGKDLAVAGYFRPGGIASAEWAVYGRANWIGKLGESLLQYPTLLDLEGQGLRAESQEGLVTLEGGTLARPLHLGRVRDVVIAGTSAELVAAARRLEVEGGTESFFNSARYADHIQNANRSGERDELEFFVDIRKLLESTGTGGALPDTKSPFFGVALLARMFQLGSFKEAVGVLGLHGGISLDLRVELSSETVTRFQERLYRSQGDSRNEILAAAAFAPADCALFAYATVPVGDLLQQMLESADPALRSNLDELFRSSGRYANVEEVIHLLDASMEGRFVFMARENDYRLEMRTNPESGQLEYVGPPNDGQTVFAATLHSWTRDAAKLEQFRETLKGMPKELGLEGRTPGSHGVFSNKDQRGGYYTIEFWSRFVPGTGVITSLFDAQIALTSNTIMMPAHVMHTGRSGGPQDPRLSERSEFVSLLDDLLQGSSANLVVWCDPDKAAATLRKQAETWARDEAAAGIDWVELRAREERRLLPDIAPGKARGELGPEEEERLAAEVDEVLRDVRDKEQEARYPILLAEKERQIVYLESIQAFLGYVRLDERRFDVGLRAVVPLPPEE